jgi:cytosine deaminase
MIGDDVTITVVDIRGDKVRLGINAPKYISVHRKEIWDQIKEENERAARVKPEDLANLPATPPAPVSVASPGETGQGNGFPRISGGEHEPFIAAAIEEARQGLAEGGLPIGSVLVRGNKIIGRGHNRRVQGGNPMAHAEIDCLTRAGRQKTYTDTILYSTLMPCYLCGGASVQFGIPRVVVGESVNFGGSPQFMRQNGIEVIDLNDSECIQMMGQFIKGHPELWNEDIGK